MRRYVAAAAASLVLISLIHATGAAAAGRLVYRNPFTIAISETEPSCSGEPIHLSGILRHEVVIVEDAAGGLHSSYAIRIHLEGTSVNGTRYIATGVNNGSEYFSIDEAPANGTFHSLFHLISADRSENLLVHATFHITVNARGAVTTFTQDVDIVCR